MWSTWGNKAVVVVALTNTYLRWAGLDNNGHDRSTGHGIGESLVYLKRGHRFHALFKVCSNSDDIFPSCLFKLLSILKFILYSVELSSITKDAQGKAASKIANTKSIHISTLADWISCSTICEWWTTRVWLIMKLHLNVLQGVIIETGFYEIGELFGYGERIQWS